MTWVTIWFSPLTISGIELWCRGIGGGIVLIGPVRDFLFAHSRVWTGDLWISIPALYHCATATSGFHLWHFQIFNSGAEGLEVVLFWLDPWKIFFLPTPGFELGTSVSLVLHSTSVQQWLLVFPSEIGGGIVLIGPVRDFLFAHTRVWNRDLWISSPALYHCDLVISGFQLWQFQVLKFGSVRLVVVLFWLDLWEIFFLPTPGFQLGISASLALHSTTVPWWPLVFTSDNFRYWSLVQRDWWWYCSDWTCERFSFCQHQGLNWGPLDL